MQYVPLAEHFSPAPQQLPFEHRGSPLGQIAETQYVPLGAHSSPAPQQLPFEHGGCPLGQTQY
jgi:hypothetical protein